MNSNIVVRFKIQFLKKKKNPSVEHALYQKRKRKKQNKTKQIM